MHDNAMAYIVNLSMAAVGEVFRFTDCGLQTWIHVGDTERQSLCKQSTSFAVSGWKHTNRNYKYCKPKTSLCVKKYFQQEVHGRLRSWRSALPRLSMKTSKVNCMGNADYKLPAEAGFICNVAPTSSAVLQLEMKDVLLIIGHGSRGNCHDYHYYHEVCV